MEINKSILEIIQERRSCRSFSDKPIDAEKLEALQNYLDDINSAMPIKARVLLSRQASDDPDHVDAAQQPERYGSIMGAQTFLIGILDRQETQVERFGYQFEKVILFSTGLGLSTCWLGGAFGRQSFEEKTSLFPGETIPIVSPIGYALERRKLADHLIRFVADSNNRKKWEELFFTRWSDQPLLEEQETVFRQPLEMLRLSPSASNKQPWRLVRNGAGFHFYLIRNAGYGLIPYDLQRNDLGIAMCHFELTAHELELPGCWRHLEPDIRPELDGLTYIRSWFLTC